MPPVRRSDLGKGDRATGLALTIQIVAKRKLAPARRSAGSSPKQASAARTRQEECDRVEEQGFRAMQRRRR